MINKKTTYNCSVEEKGFSNFYEIKPEVTIFRSGNLWYYLDKNENIRYVENEGISIFKLEDINIEEVSSLTKEQYLFLRQIYKLVKCKFRFNINDKTMFVYSDTGKDLITINDVSNLFDSDSNILSAFLESEGVFNDIL